MYCDAFLLMAALILWIPSKKFAMSLNLRKHGENRSKREKQLVVIEKEFSDLKQLAEFINDLYGVSVMLFLVETLLAYGVELTEIIIPYNSTHWKYIILHPSYLLQCHVIFFFSADVVYQVSNINVGA